MMAHFMATPITDKRAMCMHILMPADPTLDREPVAVDHILVDPEVKELQRYYKSALKKVRW